jgi:two-component system, sensor histidine kinase
MMDSAHAPSLDDAVRQIQRLEKINRALMGRVERSMDFSGGAFSLFQTAVLLDDKVKARTKDLESTLENLSDAYSSLEEARDEAETAKQNLTAAIEAITEGFALFDSEENLVMCNAPFRSLMPDISEALTSGISFDRVAEIFSESDCLVVENAQTREDWRGVRLKLFRSNFASFIQQVTGDRWIQVSNKKTASGATVIFQTDITDTVRHERERHERELDEQSRLLQATIDHLPQGIGMFSQNMRLRAWNRRLVELLALPVRSVTSNVSLDRLMDILRTTSFFLEAGSAEHLQRWLEGTHDEDVSHIEFHRFDGIVLSLSANAMPDGGLVLTFTDVTNERKSTLALREAKETLEQRVEERTAELKREVMERRLVEGELLHAKEAAEEANKGKTRFLAAASHDLLQPLNASRIFLSLLLETSLDPRQERLADNADKAFGSVEQLLESLLDISRFETRSVETNVSEFPLEDLFKTLFAEFLPLAERKGLRLRCASTSAWVRSDQGLLRRIIQNFLANALRYTDKGGILFGAQRRGSTTQIRVWDTGAGIPQDKRKVIFEEFRRLQPTGSSETKAMGLGLAIVDRIANLLGHQVGLESKFGYGSCFSITVQTSDIKRSPRLDYHKQSNEIQRSMRKLTAVIIENDLQILEGMIELLETRKIKAIPTVSAEEALEALETLEHMPDIILADYHLDHGNGLDAIKSLRRCCGKAVPAIVITANHTPSLQNELVKEDVLCLWKPIRPAALFDLIRSLTQ